MPARAAFGICGQEVAAAERRTVHLPVSVLSNHTPMTLPVHVMHGAAEGPVLFVSAVIHGDEIQGIEIIRRLLRQPALDGLCGTLLAVPVVNAYGFLNHSRYLPDRRDLNRSFPGSDKGSLASQLADLFMREVVLRSDFGIDLHTAALHRTNLPQLRVSAGRPRLMALAEAFGAPVIMMSKERDGSLRRAAQERDIDVLVYEAGEALRFDETAIRTGVAGVLRVMQHLAMISGEPALREAGQSAVAHDSYWLRAPEGGVFRAFRGAGDLIGAGERVGAIADPLGTRRWAVEARAGGIIVGRTNLPVVNRGDALFHIAEMPVPAGPGASPAPRAGEAKPLADEDEII